MQPPALRIPLRQFVAIVLALVFALVARAWLERVLLAYGYENPGARYLAYLAVPPILLIMLAPLLVRHGTFLRSLFSPQRLTLRLVLAAVALGIATRAVWWSQLVARVALGTAANSEPGVTTGPVFAWNCPPIPSLALGLFVMAMLVPLVEETLHRGLLQSALAHRGTPLAILVSAAIFTAFHPPSSYGFVFFMGLVLGMQFRVTGSLWPPMITHATYNGLIQFDWRCLQGRWNPPTDSLPLLQPAAGALLAGVAACLLVAVLLQYQRAGAVRAPARAASRARSRRVR